QEQDGVLADIISEMREERGRLGGFDDNRLRERVEVLGPELSLDVLRATISTAIVDHLGVTWDERYGELRRYKECFGDCDVPAVWDPNPQLGRWVRKQRTRPLTPERKERLQSLGFNWDPYDEAWDTRFAELEQFKRTHRHLRVSREHGQKALAI